MESDQSYVSSMRGFLKQAMRTGRFSNALVDELETHFENRTANIFQIIREIAILEGTEIKYPSETKPASQYKWKPLAGLWHKHYMQACFQQNNVRLHWSKKKKEWLDLETELMGRAATEDMWALSGEFAQRIVLGGLRKRADANEMTGEWIVFALQDGVATYLTLGSHDEGDTIIWERCQTCSVEFSDLQIFR